MQPYEKEKGKLRQHLPNETDAYIYVRVYRKTEKTKKK